MTLNFVDANVELYGSDPNGYHKAENEYHELEISCEGEKYLVWGCPHCGMLKIQKRVK